MSGVRVVHVVCSDGFAGVERHVAVLAPALAEIGCDVVVLGGSADEMPAALEPHGVRWRRADTPSQAARQLARIGRAQVVHAHMTEAEMVALAARPLHRAPVVSTLHFAAPRGSGRVVRRAAGLIGHGLSAQIAISDFVAAAAGGATHVVRAGVPAGSDRRTSARRDRVVLVVQRLETEKDTGTAVRAWAASGLRREGWRLQIAGGGAERDALLRLAADLGVAGTVDLLGARSDVPDLLRSAGMLLATTPREGLGLAVIEAMAAGVPVVASDAGGHRETIGTVCGATLFAAQDAGGAGVLLDRLGADPAWRDELGERSQQRQRDALSVESQARATLAVYEEVLR